MRCKLPWLCLHLLLLVSLAVQPSHCKGVPRTKGSGARGNRKGGRYGSSTNSGYSSLTLLIRSRFSFLTKWMAYRMGIIFVTRDWRAAHPDYSDSMTLCYNVLDGLPGEHLDSVLLPWIYQNRTVLGLYVCPIDGRTDKLYCCGSNEGQACCTFWDDSSRLSSVVVGSLLALLSSFLFGAWLYRWSRRYLRWKTHDQHKVELHQSPILKADEPPAIIRSGGGSNRSNSGRCSCNRG